MKNFIVRLTDRLSVDLDENTGTLQHAFIALFVAFVVAAAAAFMLLPRNKAPQQQIQAATQTTETPKVAEPALFVQPEKASAAASNSAPAGQPTPTAAAEAPTPAPAAAPPVSSSAAASGATHPGKRATPQKRPGH